MLGIFIGACTKIFLRIYDTHISHYFLDVFNIYKSVFMAKLVVWLALDF